MRKKPHLILIPDGSLHLLPFSALVDGKQYLLQTHEVSVTPSSTVLHILKVRSRDRNEQSLPYIGCLETLDARNFVSRASLAPHGASLRLSPPAKERWNRFSWEMKRPRLISGASRWIDSMCCTSHCTAITISITPTFRRSSLLRYGRSTRGEYRLFLGHARGSACELETQLVIGRSLGFEKAEDLAFAESLLAEISRMLGALLRSLRAG